MPTPLIVGADLSSKYLALVAKHPVTPTAAMVKYPLAPNKAAPYSPANAAEALDSMLEYVDSIASMAIPGAERLAYIEAPVIGRGGAKPTISQSFVNGVVQAVFVKSGFKVYLVPNTTWKKVVCGNGNADKQQIAAHLARVWPVVSNGCDGDQDLIDAASVCLYGSEIERRRQV